MKIEKVIDITRIYKRWLDVQLVVDCFLPTQDFYYYKWLCIAFKSHMLRNFNKRIVFFNCEEGGNCCIIPLVEYKKKRQLYGLAVFGRLDYEDIITNTRDEQFLKAAIQSILQRYPEYTLHYENINQNSVLYQLFSPLCAEKENCVKINLPEDYDAYIASLSKHQRQNIRTAYNKISKEGFDIRLEEYNSFHHIPLTLWHTCESIYEARHDYQSIDNIFDRLSNPYHHILRKSPNHWIYVLKHQNVPIAYMAGLVSADGKQYLVPRLCINPNFYEYSPGIILICETAKRLIAKGMTCLDLMLGDEPYKLAMGGTITTNYSLKQPIEEVLKLCIPR